jgi:CHRD domain-containing protein
VAVKKQGSGIRYQVSAVLCFLLLATMGCATAPRAASYCAELKGAGPGSDALDPEASGTARLEVGGASIRFHITTSPNLGKVVATHLHQGAAGVNGPMAVELNPGFTGEVLDGSIPVDSDLATRVLSNPGQYYVKLHSLKFPGGAIRGQLHTCSGRS